MTTLIVLFATMLTSILAVMSLTSQLESVYITVEETKEVSK